MKFTRSLLVFFSAILSIQLCAQLTVSNTPSGTYGSPPWLVDNVLLGPGVTASGTTFTGDSIQLGYFNGVASNIDLPEGIILCTGNIDIAPGGPGNTSGSAGTGTMSSGYDSDLVTLINSTNINDVAVLEFDFIPLSDSLEFNYVFASEEYQEYNCSVYNDVFGFFISGPGISGPFSGGAENLAVVPGTTTPVMINSINNGVAAGSSVNCSDLDPAWATYSVYHVDNSFSTDPNSVEYDGFTVPLKAEIGNLQCGEVYHIKLAIADVGDGAFDSAVLLEEGSFASEGLIVELKLNVSDSTLVEGCRGADLILYRSDTSFSDTAFVIPSGSAVDGVDYTALDSFYLFPPGADSFAIHIDPIVDGLTEGIDTIELEIPGVLSCTDSSARFVLYIQDEYTIDGFGDDTLVNCGYDSVLIGVDVVGATDPITYSWSTGDTLDSIWVLPPVTDTFFITATDYYGCSDSDSVEVVINLPLTPVDAGVDSSFCMGDSLPLLAMGDGISYTWSPGSGLTDSTVFDPVAFGEDTQIYIVQQIDSNNCKNFDTVVIVGNALPNLITSGISPICQGDSTLITSIDGVPDTCFYYLELQDLLGSGWGDGYIEVVVDGDSVDSYTLAPFIFYELYTLTFVSGQTVDFVYHASTDSTVSTLFSVYDQFFINLYTSTTTPPDGTTFTTIADCGYEAGTSTVFSWDPWSTLSDSTGSMVWASPDTTTTYVVSALDTLTQCSRTDTFYLEVISPDNVNITELDTNFCNNDSPFQFEASPSGGTWIGTGLDPATGIFTPSSVTPGVYTISYQISGTCVVSDQVDVEVNPVPSTPSVIDNGPYCEGETMTLAANGSGGEVTWYLDSALTLIADTNLIAIGSPTYYIQEISPDSCISPVGMYSPTIFVNPDASFNLPGDYVPGESLVPLNMIFENTSLGNNLMSNWYLDGGFQSDDWDYSQFFEDGGSYTVKLYVEDTITGCFDETEISIELLDYLLGPVPNVFTPANQDGMNDLFYVIGRGLEAYEVEIYNRWGTKVYECGPVVDPIDCGWDGENHPEGTYYYLIRVKDYQGEDVDRDDLHGYVTLIKKK